MGRYTELERLATKQTTAFYEQRSACELFAARLIRDFRAYLEAPSASITFLELARDLKPGNVSAAPRLVWSGGKWHFSIRLLLQPDESSVFSAVDLTFGILPSDSAFEIHWERNFTIDPSALDPFLPLLDFIYEGLLEDYAKPVGAPKPRIGFL